MNALTDADTRRGGKNPPHAGLTSSVSPKAHSDGVSSPNVPIGNGEKPAWFALRVTYGRVEKAAELLRKEKVSLQNRRGSTCHRWSIQRCSW